jgi:renalase
MTRIAIIGAGIAGLALARLLQPHAELVVFDKSRGVGGRMASRRIGTFGFDHGAQYFTARSSSFRRFLQSYRERGLVQEWQPRVLTLEAGEKPYTRAWFEPHYVAVPGMTALCKAMAEGLDLQLGMELGVPQRQTDGRWRVLPATAEDSGLFDWVLCTAPPAQAQALLPAGFCGQAQLAVLTMKPCIALLLGLQHPPSWRFDAARIKHPVLDWLSCEASRPGRNSSFAVTLHSNAAWAAGHLDDPDEVIATCMLEALDAVTAHPLPPLAVQQVKRWRHAQADAPEQPLLLLDAELKLAACGDWARDGRIEGAFLAAQDLARAVQACL